MHHKPTSPSHALLPALTPALTVAAQYSTGPWPSTKRILQLRGPALLVSKPGAPATLESSKLLVLNRETFPIAVGSRSALYAPDALSPAHKFRFSTRRARDDFLATAWEEMLVSQGASQRYNVLRELGHGTESTLYLVERAEDCRLFAMKAIDKHAVMASPTQLARLVGERVALAEAAEHGCAFVQRLVDAFETMGRFCFVMELGGYGDLQQVMKKLPEQRFEEEVARAIFAEIVAGLEETHRLGYLYRDLKLESVILTREGHVRLANFGLVKRLDVKYEGSSISSDAGSDEEEDKEPFRLVGRTKSFVGTRRYMSPEHLGGAHAVKRGYGAPADLWALGVTLYIMLTGQLPFGRHVSSRNSAAVFHAIQHEAVEYPEWLGKGAKGMLEGLLNRDADKRLGIEEVKRHPWMKGVDWARVRKDSLNGETQELVTAFLKASRVETVEERSCLGGSISEGRLVSSLSKGGPSSGGRRRSGPMSFELLGFGYSTVSRVSSLTI